jgi:hypothetical protein
LTANKQVSVLQNSNHCPSALLTDPSCKFLERKDKEVHFCLEIDRTATTINVKSQLHPVLTRPTLQQFPEVRKANFWEGQTYGHPIVQSLQHVKSCERHPRDNPVVRTFPHAACAMQETHCELP